MIKKKKKIGRETSASNDINMIQHPYVWGLRQTLNGSFEKKKKKLPDDYLAIEMMN